MVIQVPLGAEEKRVKGPLELELQVTVSSPMWLLGTEAGSVPSCRAAPGASSALVLVGFVWLWLWFGFGGQSVIMWFGLA